MLIRFLKKQPLWVGDDTVIWSSLPGGLKLDSGGTSVSHCGAAIFVFKCTTALCSHDLHGGQTLSCKIRPVVVASAQRASILGEIVPVITQVEKKNKQKKKRCRHIWSTWQRHWTVNTILLSQMLRLIFFLSDWEFY